MRKAVPTAIRIPPADLEEIDRRAEEHGLSRTQYLIRSALGRLDVENDKARLDEIETRLAKLERRGSRGSRRA